MTKNSLSTQPHIDSEVTAPKASRIECTHEAHPIDLFPLRLNAFEKFMLADETEDFPSNCLLQIRLRGILDRMIIQRAVEVAIRRHPLLSCIVEKKGRDLYWVWQPHTRLKILWSDESEYGNTNWNSPIDLYQNIGLRIAAKQNSKNAIMTIQIHHACCDGIGAAQFLEDVAIAYSQIYSSKNENAELDVPEFRRLDWRLLSKRNQSDGRRIAGIRGSVFRRMRVRLRYSLEYLRESKLQLKRLPNEKSQERDQKPGPLEFGLLTTRLTRDETRGLRKFGSQFGATMNDVLLRELMLTAATWIMPTERTKKSLFRWKKPTICILVPSSLRGSTDSQLPACNVVSFVFVSKTEQTIQKPGELLMEIRDDMRLVHKVQAGWLFIKALESVGRIPGLMSLMIWKNRNRCMSTTVLSHLGNLFSAIGSRLPKKDGLMLMGDVQIEDACGVPPVRRGTFATFSSIMINGCLSITIHSSPNHFSPAEAKELLSSFTNRLRHTANGTENC